MHITQQSSQTEGSPGNANTDRRNSPTKLLTSPWGHLVGSLHRGAAICIGGLPMPSKAPATVLHAIAIKALWMHKHWLPPPYHKYHCSYNARQTTTTMRFTYGPQYGVLTYAYSRIHLYIFFCTEPKFFCAEQRDARTKREPAKRVGVYPKGPLGRPPVPYHFPR